MEATNTAQNICELGHGKNEWIPEATLNMKVPDGGEITLDGLVRQLLLVQKGHKKTKCVLRRGKRREGG